MDYKIKENLNELNLKEEEYYEIYPGIFHNKFWNDNSIFISIDIEDIIMDIKCEIYKKQSKENNNDNNFGYFDVNEVNIIKKNINITSHY